MLPFTKRPGRSDEPSEVVTKDDLSESRSSVRKPMPSVTDEDEQTKHMPRKALGDAINAILPAAGRPPPAAGRPATVPPPSRSRPPPSVRPAPSSRPSALDEEEGRTMVRGGPRIVKKRGSNPSRGEMGMPTAVQPSAVIKQSLEAARASNRPDPLMAPPPRELLEDIADRMPASVPPPPPSAANMTGPHPQLHMTGPHAQLQMTGPHPQMQLETAALGMAPVAPPSQRFAAPHSQRFMTGPPPPSQPYGYGPPPSQAPMSVRSMPMSQPPPPSSAMPAHFMVAQADPPGVANTGNHARAGRPAASWAGALLAFGLFVGIGAVAVMQSSEMLIDTTASFVDPARAGQKTAAARAREEGAPIPVPMQPATGEAPKVSVPAVAVEPPPAAAAPVVAVNAPAPAAAPEPAPEPPTTAAKSAHASRPTFVAPPPRREAAPAPAPAAKPAAPAKPAPAAVAANDEEPKPEKKPAKGAKPAKGSADSDEETRKAIEALQKSQLESSF